MGFPAAAAVAADFSHHVVAVTLPPKSEQAGDPLLADFYIDAGRDQGVLPGTEFWVYRLATIRGHGQVAIPVGRLETIHVEERVSVARVAALTVPETHPFVEYRTIMLGDPIEVILGTGFLPLGEWELPIERIGITPTLVPPLAPEDRGKRTFYIPNVVLFDFDKSTLRPEGQALLEQIAAYIREAGAQRVRIEGHTDAIGTEAYNEGLGRRRAAAAKRYLSETLDIPADRITTTGFGETRPVDDNATATGRQRNRRSEVIVDGRRPGHQVPDGLAITPEAIVPETRAAAPASAPAISGPPPAEIPNPDHLFPELARPAS